MNETVQCYVCAAASPMEAPAAWPLARYESCGPLRVPCVQREATLTTAGAWLARGPWPDATRRGPWPERARAILSTEQNRAASKVAENVAAAPAGSRSAALGHVLPLAGRRPARGDIIAGASADAKAKRVHIIFKGCPFASTALHPLGRKQLPTRRGNVRLKQRCSTGPGAAPRCHHPRRRRGARSRLGPRRG